MRIAISTSVIQRGRSGVAQYVLSLVRHLVREHPQHDYGLFVLEEDLSLFDSVADAAQVKFHIVAERFRPAVRNVIWHQTAFPRALRREAYEVAHVPSYRRLIWSKPCTLVGTIHDLAPLRMANKYDWKRNAYARHVVRRFAHRQNRLIAVSQTTARDISEFFHVPRSSIRVIYNGIDHQRFFPVGEASLDEFRKRNGLPKPFFLYVARLEHPAKNHVRLIQAFELFKTRTNLDWELVFGGSDWHGAEQIHAAIRASPHRKNIVSLGFVKAVELPDLYRAATAFVYPSLFEGFGLPPVEAMACGCPVICSPRGALAEVVGSAAAIVDPENVDEIALWMTRMAIDEKLRKTFQEAGLRQASRYNWERTARETVETYEAATAARPSTALVCQA